MTDDLIRRQDALNFELTIEGPREAEEAILRTSQGIMDYIKSIPAVNDVELRGRGEWDMFDLITCSYYGKWMYFREPDGIVYSRHTGKHMEFKDALFEFLELING